MKFSDVIGQLQVKDRLRHMVADGRIPHAMLFLGSEGSGALPMAYALAQYICCQGDRSNGDSCGVCPSCSKIQKLVHPDVHSIFPIAKLHESDDCDAYLPEWREMVSQVGYFSLSEWSSKIQLAKPAATDDDASDDSPDAAGSKKAKQLLIPKTAAVAIHQKLSMKPYEADKQILVLWRPELMNDATSNSLLKILEEPPSDTIFILVSEDASAILPTILSRTQVFSVPPLSDADIAARLSVERGLNPADAAEAAHIAQGNYVVARRNVDEAQDLQENLSFFQRFMRTSYMGDVVAMSALADDFRALARDRVKDVLAYCQHMVRESFIMNLARPELSYVNSDEKNFLMRFAPFVHVANVEKIAALFDNAIAMVERNGNVKMVILDVSLHLSALIRRTQRPKSSE